MFENKKVNRPSLVLYDNIGPIGIQILRARKEKIVLKADVIVCRVVEFHVELTNNGRNCNKHLRTGKA